MNHEIDKLYQKKNNIIVIQDSFEINDRCIYDKENNWLFTNNEKVKKKLIKNNHDI